MIVTFSIFSILILLVSQTFTGNITIVSECIKSNDKIIIGTEGNDCLIGGQKTKIIVGLGGDDILVGKKAFCLGMDGIDKCDCKKTFQCEDVTKSEHKGKRVRK